MIHYSSIRSIPREFRNPPRVKIFEQVCFVSFNGSHRGDRGWPVDHERFSWSDVDFFYRWVSLLSFLLSRLTSNSTTNRTNPRVYVRAFTGVHEETWITRALEFWRVLLWEKRCFNWNVHDPSNSFSCSLGSIFFFFLEKLNIAFEYYNFVFDTITIIIFEYNFKYISHEINHISRNMT